MKTKVSLSQIQSDLDALQKEYGLGVSYERRAEAYLRTTVPSLDDEQVYDIIDGDAQLCVVDGEISTEPIDEPYFDKITNDNGWLSPDGRFYSCRYHGHDHLAGRIAKSRGYKTYNPYGFLESSGYVKVQRKPSGDDQLQWFFHMRDLEEGVPAISEIQKKMVADFCVRQKIEIPYNYS